MLNNLLLYIFIKTNLLYSNFFKLIQIIYSNLR